VIDRSGHSALLFPGQGSQNTEMGTLVERYRPDLYAQLFAALGRDAFHRIAEDSRFLQPAIYCASLAAWEGAGRPEADLMAGHSLGEFAALAAAGVIDHADGLRLTIERGRLMQEALDQSPDGGMVALLGDRQKARAVIDACGLTLANDNAPEQIVAAGETRLLDEAVSQARRRGLRIKRLAVPGALHTAALESAVEPFRAALKQTAFVASPRAQVVSCTTARPFDQARERLAAALVRPVLWRETLIELRRLGAELFIETGPGRALTGTVRRTLIDVDASTISIAQPIEP
jgi:[acyl-carrier-protein] S-malonyltransferase